MLDDEELDSGDDEARNDRVASEAPAEMETREDVIEYPDLMRHALPEPSDGEVIDSLRLTELALMPNRCIS